MTTPPGKPASDLLRAAQDLDPERIDALYGLEPVYEPVTDPENRDRTNALEFVEMQCPWCGEVMGSQVDVSAGSLMYIEDCQVCCRPMEIHIECTDAGRLRDVSVRRSD